MGGRIEVEKYFCSAGSMENPKTQIAGYLRWRAETSDNGKDQNRGEVERAGCQGVVGSLGKIVLVMS